MDTRSWIGSTRELLDYKDQGVVRLLQYEVREGREAGEVVVIPKAFIANRNSSFILQEVFGGSEDQVCPSAEPEA